MTRLVERRAFGDSHEAHLIESAGKSWIRLKAANGQCLGHWSMSSTYRAERKSARLIRRAPAQGYVDTDGQFPWLLEWEELHRTRNKYNKCPPTSPNSCSTTDTRRWTQDTWGDMKWRGSDGSECVYDERGDLVPDKVAFNYCANPWSACHFFADVLPHYVLGPGWWGPTKYGHP